MTEYTPKMDKVSLKVAVRARPLFQIEQDRGNINCLDFSPGEPNTVIVGMDKPYTLDHTYNENCDQDMIYTDVVAPLVIKLFDGYNATVLAYGQTGTGKTYTIGTNYTKDDKRDDVGLIPRALEDIFNQIHHNYEKENVDFSVSVSCFEIYNEQVLDLLNKDGKKVPRIIREERGIFFIRDINEHVVKDEHQALQYLECGSALRCVSETIFNNRSSRSHMLFSVTLKQWRSDADRTSKLIMVDLAGSESLKQTQADGIERREGIGINQSLLDLGTVLADLSKGKRNVCRGSAITKLLKDSLNGNSYISMIVCISPSNTDLNDTIKTLRFATVSKKIKLAPERICVLIQDRKKRLTYNSRKKLMALNIPPTPANKLRYHTNGFDASLATPMSGELQPRVTPLNLTLPTPGSSLDSTTFFDPNQKYQRLTSTLIRKITDRDYDSSGNDDVFQTPLRPLSPGGLSVASSGFSTSTNLQYCQMYHNPQQDAEMTSIKNRLEVLEREKYIPVEPRPKKRKVPEFNTSSCIKTRYSESYVTQHRNLIVKLTQLPLVQKVLKNEPVFKKPDVLSGKRKKAEGRLSGGEKRVQRRSMRLRMKPNISYSASVSRLSSRYNTRMESCNDTVINKTLNVVAYKQTKDKVLNILNNGTVKMLQSLPTVGPKTANIILTYRTLHGNFSSHEDLEKVKGLPKTFYKRFITGNIPEF